MRLVFDTNKLFSFFWKGSLISKLLSSDHDLYSPKFALEELDKHKLEILKKARLSSTDFEEFKIKLQNVIEFVHFSEYSDKIPEAFNLMPVHAKDIDFLALALKLNAAILSNDKELKMQSAIEIFNDTRIPELF